MLETIKWVLTGIGAITVIVGIGYIILWIYSRVTVVI